MEQSASVRSLGIFDYWSIFKKRWILAFISFISVVVTALIYEANKPPVFSAFVDIMINPEPTGEQVKNLQLSQRKRIAEMNFEYYVEHARSEACISAVIAQGIFGTVPPPKTPEWLNLIDEILNVTTAERLSDRRIIRISVTSNSPDYSFRLANAFGSAYVSSITEQMISSHQRMSKYLETEIENTDKELSNYRAGAAYLERVLGITEENKNEQTEMRTRIISVRDNLRSRAAAVDAVSDSIEKGLMPDITEMELAVTGLFSAIPDDFSREMGGALRDQLEAARGKWIEKLNHYKLLCKTMTEFHPDRAIAKNELFSASINLIAAIESWYRFADGQFTAKLVSIPEVKPEPLPEVNVSALLGETTAPTLLTLNRLQSEISIRESLLTDLIKKKSMLNLEKVGQDRIAEWIRPASKPTRPNNPNLDKGLIMGSLLGLLVAVAAVFIVESLDLSIKTPFSAEHILGKRVLQIIPCFSDPLASQTEATASRLVLIQRPFSPEAEAYRALAHKLDAQEARFIVVTSTGPQEGKSTTVSNLACALAEMGRSILLVSANLRRPTLHKIFEMKETPGVAEVVRDEISLEDAIVKTSVDNLFLLPSGTIGNSSIASIISSVSFVTALRESLGKYDFILVDVPPAAPVSDALSYARSADAVLLIYMIGRASETAVSQVIRSIEDVGGKIIGLVLNDIRGIGQAYGYNYSDRYYHYTKEEPII